MASFVRRLQPGLFQRHPIPGRRAGGGAVFAAAPGKERKGPRPGAPLPGSDRNGRSFRMRPFMRPVPAPAPCPGIGPFCQPASDGGRLPKGICFSAPVAAARDGGVPVPCPARASVFAGKIPVPAGYPCHPAADSFHKKNAARGKRPTGSMVVFSVLVSSGNGPAPAPFTPSSEPGENRLFHQPAAALLRFLSAQLRSLARPNRPEKPRRSFRKACRWPASAKGYRGIRQGCSPCKSCSTR